MLVNVISCIVIDVIYKITLTYLTVLKKELKFLPINQSF
jgi:hypothetical protein